MYAITETLANDLLDCLACLFLSTVDDIYNPKFIKQAERFSGEKFKELCDSLDIDRVIADENF